MEPMGGSDHILLIMLGVTVVITLRAFARAERLKREASAKQRPGSGRRSIDENTPAGTGQETR
jgi:hypothetical protein